MICCVCLCSVGTDLKNGTQGCAVNGYIRRVCCAADAAAALCCSLPLLLLLLNSRGAERRWVVVFGIVDISERFARESSHARRGQIEELAVTRPGLGFRELVRQKTRRQAVAKPLGRQLVGKRVATANFDVSAFWPHQPGANE